jgi:hypothetical protein
MKLYSTPIPFADPDYTNYDSLAEQAREDAHRLAVEVWLQQNGWSGPRTGEILREPMGDGYAQYMYGDAPGSKACLIHLPYGDAWHSQNVEFLPKKEVLARLDAEKRLRKLFSKIP